jgi:septal ring factor EnvC (AmiA/AmiB activator)
MEIKEQFDRQIASLKNELATNRQQNQEQREIINKQIADLERERNKPPTVIHHGRRGGFFGSIGGILDKIFRL